MNAVGGKTQTETHEARTLSASGSPGNHQHAPRTLALDRRRHAFPKKLVALARYGSICLNIGPDRFVPEQELVVLGGIVCDFGDLLKPRFFSTAFRSGGEKGDA